MTTSGPLVYLVDDDPAVLRGLARLLQAWGYRARTFASAQEFLAHREQDPDVPDCLLLDVHMPSVSGVDLQAYLSLEDRSLPVVFITGHLDATLHIDAVASGTADFLQKPVSDHDLLRAVQRAVERRQDKPDMTPPR